jgi:gamma-glutamyltranspeptidase
MFCIGVMDTQSAGMGGGHFMTFYNAYDYRHIASISAYTFRSTKTCHVVDAREVAPLAATENMYKDRWDKSKYGWEAVGVPGQLHGLRTAFTEFGSGKVSWSSLIDGTIRLMEEGYPTSHALASGLKQNEKAIMNETTMRTHFLNPATGKLYQRGEQITTRRNLLETFRVLAASTDPIAEFYTGKLAKAMVEEFQRNGGIIRREDFAKYESIVRRDEDVVYTRLSHGRILCGPPPPAGSVVTLAILNILDR